MTVASCVQYYNDTVGGGTWDVQVVTRKVLAAKDELYEKLTAEGIQAFAGARALILEAKSLGISIGVGSSGVPLMLISCSGAVGLGT
jgi:beta-phosphoglucomutase-like phosphatase (HAD superfamily)